MCFNVETLHTHAKIIRQMLSPNSPQAKKKKNQPETAWKYMKIVVFLKKLSTFFVFPYPKPPRICTTCSFFQRYPDLYRKLGNLHQEQASEGSNMVIFGCYESELNVHKQKPSRKLYGCFRK